MLRRTTPLSLKDYCRYFSGGNPRDEWIFEVEGLIGKVYNEWCSGAKLYAQEQLIDSNDQLFSVRGRRAVLSGLVTDRDGKSRKIEVFVRALLFVKIRILVDGKTISQKFI